MIEDFISKYHVVRTVEYTAIGMCSCGKRIDNDGGLSLENHRRLYKDRGNKL